MKFNKFQMEEIRLGLEAGVDVMIYANPKFTSGQMEEIRKGLEAGVDVSKYADTNLDWRQMSEIRLGLEAGVDATTYAKPELDDEQMGAFKKQLAYLEALSFNSETLEELTNIRPEPLMAEGTTWARIHPLFVKRGQEISIDGIYLEEKDSVNVHSKFTAYLVPFDFTVTYREALNYNTHKRPVPIIKEEQNFVEELYKFADVIVTNYEGEETGLLLHTKDGSGYYWER